MFEFHSAKDFKNKKVKIYSSMDLEPQEIFLDKLAQQKEEDLGISEKKLEVPIQKRIIYGLFLFAAISLALLFLKTFQLQVVDGEKWQAMAKENKFNFIK